MWTIKVVCNLLHSLWFALASIFFHPPLFVFPLYFYPHLSLANHNWPYWRYSTSMSVRLATKAQPQRISKSSHLAWIRSFPTPLQDLPPYMNGCDDEAPDAQPIPSPDLNIIVQPSNPAFMPSLGLLRPAPLKCGEGKGHSEQCGRKKAARPQYHRIWLFIKHFALEKYKLFKYQIFKMVLSAL